MIIIYSKCVRVFRPSNNNNNNNNNRRPSISIMLFLCTDMGVCSTGVPKKVVHGVLHITPDRTPDMWMH